MRSDPDPHAGPTLRSLPDARDRASRDEPGEAASGCARGRGGPGVAGAAATVPERGAGREGELPDALLRPFRILAFDWDGTAVESRKAECGEVCALLGELLQLGVYVVVITGTSIGNVDRQFTSGIRGPQKRRLFALTNRGSEVYGFDERGHPILLWQRKATAAEDRLLTETADAVRDALVARTGLEIGVVYDRLNRRKIDLIPLPEWAEPPKSATPVLLEAVEARLRGAGLEGGIAEAYALAQRTARDEGLADARITSDVKHIEVGLSDKSDSVRWVLEELAAERAIPREEVLIAGDEFGRVAGFEGSDARMIVPGANGVVYASVGPEPGGAPPGVIHLGGGPARFRDLVASQVALHRSRKRQADGAAPAIAERLDPVAHPTTEPEWLLVEEGFNLAREHEIESLLALSNGYLGVRASLAEGTAISSPAALVAGVFTAQQHSPMIPALVRLAPGWLRLRVAVEGRDLALDQGEALEHRRVLDLKQGILWRQWRHRDPDGRITRLRFLRLVSLADRNLMLQSVALTPENYSGLVEVTSRMEEPPEEEVQEAAAPVALPSVHGPPLAEDALAGWGTAVVTLHMPGTPVAIAFAAASRLQTEDGKAVAPEMVVRDDQLLERWRFEAEMGRTYRLDRLVAVHTSRDTLRPDEAVARHLGELLEQGVEGVVRAHIAAWEERWRTAGVEIRGDEEAQRAVRFACYHLISAANPEDERASIGARALTGEAYKGHVFWDTEIYMLPFYIHTHPPTARALLMYRYHTLDAARRKARALGWQGALYAWESADTGEETTPRFVLEPDGEVGVIRNGEQEIHISADVAHGVWQYWQGTGDDDFLLEAGAEIVLETARFWASRCRLEEDGRFHIRQVIGPDEYHEGVDDNAYTNVMAQWNLERGAEVAELVARRWPDRWPSLAERIALSPEEPLRWREVARAMYTGFDPRSGLFEQFRGYFDLEELDLEAYEPRTAPLDVILGRERVRRTKVIKQADVVQLLHLFWDRFPPEVREANFRYYEPRCGHGSSLSPAIHALVAARLGDTRLAAAYLKQAAEVDLANNMGNAAGGVHAAALGGLWQATVFGMAGVGTTPEGVRLAPHLPPAWDALAFPFRWRDRQLEVRVGARGEQVEVALREGEPLSVALEAGPATTLARGERQAARRTAAGWEPWRRTAGDD